MAEATPTASRALPETVADAVEVYLDGALSRMRAATYRAVELRMKHVLGDLSRHDLNEPTPAEFEAYRDRRLRTRSPATVAGEL